MITRLLAIGGGAVVGALALIGSFQNAEILRPVAVVYCSVHSEPPPLIAKSAYAFDVTTGVELYAHDADAQLPLASLTKLMTVTVALQALTPTSTVPITRDALAPDGESGLTVGDTWGANELADFSLIESSNDGVHALMLQTISTLHETADDFISAMNHEAERLGLTQTFFVNDTGLDISSTTAGAYGSARDVAHLIAAVHHDKPDILERSPEPEATFVSGMGKKYVAKNTSRVGGDLTGAVATKTGFTDLAGGNMAALFEPVPGHIVALAVLGSTREGRESDMRALAAYATRDVRRAILCQAQP